MPVATGVVVPTLRVVLDQPRKVRRHRLAALVLQRGAVVVRAEARAPVGVRHLRRHAVRHVVRNQM